MANQNVVDVLIHARELVEATWVGRTPNRSIGEHCALTAIGAAASSTDREMYDALAEKSNEYLSRAANVQLISSWNDRSSKEQVLAAFDRAIERASRER